MTLARWTSEEVAFLQQNYLTLGAGETAKQLGKSKSSVHWKIRKVGGGREQLGKRIDWTEQELDLIRQEYQNVPIAELAVKLGRTEHAVTTRAHMLGMIRYKDVSSFFENIDEKSAYVFGFFAADGWASKRGPKSIRVSLCQKERQILDDIAAIIGEGTVLEKDNGTFFEYYVQSVAAYNALCEFFGCDVCRKSLTLLWPKSIPDNMLRHFIRGATDGDGSLMLRRDGYWEYSYTSGSYHFIVGLADAIYSHTGIKLSVGLNKIKVWHARITGIGAVCLFDWLYSDCTIALDRKKQLAETAMQHSGNAHKEHITPKMYELFGHILSNYKIF